MSPEQTLAFGYMGWFNLCFRERLTVSLSLDFCSFFFIKEVINITFYRVMVSLMRSRINRLSGL